mmetsp:Transcript_80901/g.204507  ORF Transcript_80901/g.204507 Transcript_80901/m.204507 type:complete len:234 (+) Transcript_80901:744-1445(+)
MKICLPAQLASDAVLLQQRLVVGLQCRHIWHRVSLGVQVELVELFHPLHHLSILRSLQMRVGTLVMPRVEGVEADHVQTGLWDRAAVLLQHPVHVLIVAPGHHQVRNAALRLVHAILRTVDRVLQVGVGLERLQAEDALVGRGAAHRESVADHGPLFQHVLTRDLWERQNLADVVQQPHEMEPIMVRPLLADALRSLKVVDAVRELIVGIGVVHKVVQKRNHLHDCEFSLVEL